MVHLVSNNDEQLLFWVSLNTFFKLIFSVQGTQVMPKLWRDEVLMNANHYSVSAAGLFDYKYLLATLCFSCQLGSWLPVASLEKLT